MAEVSWASMYVVLSVVVLSALWTRTQTYKLRHIPTVGTTIPVFSYLEGLNFFHNARRKLQEGYDRHAARGGIFKVAMPDQWLVGICQPNLVDELSKKLSDTADLRGGINQLVIRRTEMPNVEPLHVQLLYAKAGQLSAGSIPAIKGEIWHVFDTDIGLPEEWRCVPMFDTMTGIVMKVVNRLFVGLPLCRDEEFLCRARAYIGRNHSRMNLVGKFPRSLIPWIAELLLPGPESFQAIFEYLAPTIRERRVLIESSGSLREGQHGLQDDFLTWLLVEAVNRGYSDEAVVFLLMSTEQAALLNTSATFTKILFHLVSDPSLVHELREEVEMVLAAKPDGSEWTKDKLGELHRMDSFLRECIRVHGIHMTTLWRLTRKPIVLSNGISIPSGTFVSAATAACHRDEHLYQDPETFDPWRFVNSSKTLITTDVGFVAFGHGRYACPGRHLAAYEMKLMLAYILMTYDIAFPPGQSESQSVDFWNLRLPNPNTNVMFRRRQTEVN